MLASGSKQFQGVVEITEIDVDGGTESANFFLILHDESLSGITGLNSSTWLLNVP